MANDYISVDTSISDARTEAARLLARHKRKRVPETLGVRVAVDKRSKAGRACRQLERALLKHCGPRPSAAQLAMIAQLLQLKLRLALLDMRFLENDGAMTGHDARVYLSWNNSYVRGLKSLGLDASPEPPMSLTEALRAGAPVARRGTPTTPAAADDQAAAKQPSGPVPAPLVPP
jgi:hypothetical protein